MTVEELVEELTSEIANHPATNSRKVVELQMSHFRQFIQEIEVPNLPPDSEHYIGHAAGKYDMRHAIITELKMVK